MGVRKALCPSRDQCASGDCRAVRHRCAACRSVACRAFSFKRAAVLRFAAVGHAAACPVG
eukprot:2028717-Pleurochrysis_carterae.AAC.1